jgi:hypothetical protein
MLSVQLMGSERKLKPMTEFPLILTEGGDDRLPLDPKTGANKYHGKPFVMPDSAFRGSCTCNSPTPLGFEAAKMLYQQFSNGAKNCETSMQETREKLMELFELPQGTGIFLMPSGSDAEYIPLLIAKLRNKDKNVVNIVTCNEEVGSGTLDAAGGKFFSAVEPIHYGSGAKAGDPVEGLASGVENFAIGARLPSGEVVEQNEEIHKALFKCE